MTEKVTWNVDGIAELLLRVGQGAHEDFEKLLNRFEPLILKLVKEFDFQYHEDIKEELMIELFLAAKHFKPITTRNRGDSAR
ncbi:helix-turn-helix domain-containing protein [Paenibacillus sp. PR3]|uniref:Helix-turn-helix domain-containing protein n=1 Tax=Paenibacillus terricola TaxID=2763503 RepID=A0ABR8MZF0_9BACL|nr:helix-turn-helix domain-containing protein [Paenibacillus terricola]